VLVLLPNADGYAAEMPCEAEVESMLSSPTARERLGDVARCFRAAVLDGFDPRTIQSPSQVPARWFAESQPYENGREVSALRWFAPHVSGSWAIFYAADRDGLWAYHAANDAIRGSVMDRIALRTRTFLILGLGLLLGMLCAAARRRWLAALLTASLAASFFLLSYAQERSLDSPEAQLLLSLSPADLADDASGAACDASAIAQLRCAAQTEDAKGPAVVFLLETSALRSEPHPLVEQAARLRIRVPEAILLALLLAAAGSSAIRLITRRRSRAMSEVMIASSAGGILVWALCITLDMQRVSLGPLAAFPLGIAEGTYHAASPMFMPEPLFLLAAFVIVGIFGGWLAWLDRRHPGDGATQPDTRDA
jgi:hypothetical protein